MSWGSPCTDQSGYHQPGGTFYQEGDSRNLYSKCRDCGIEIKAPATWQALSQWRPNLYVIEEEVLW
jgi:hypothetical protein